jgi:hypothetical protein
MGAILSNKQYLMNDEKEAAFQFAFDVLFLDKFAQN